MSATTTAEVPAVKYGGNAPIPRRLVIADVWTCINQDKLAWTSSRILDVMAWTDVDCVHERFGTGLILLSPGMAPDRYRDNGFETAWDEAAETNGLGGDKAWRHICVHHDDQTASVFGQPDTWAAHVRIVSSLFYWNSRNAKTDPVYKLLTGHLGLKTVADKRATDLHLETVLAAGTHANPSDLYARYEEIYVLQVDSAGSIIPRAFTVGQP